MFVVVESKARSRSSSCIRTSPNELIQHNSFKIGHWSWTFGEQRARHWGREIRLHLKSKTNGYFWRCLRNRTAWQLPNGGHCSQCRAPHQPRTFRFLRNHNCPRNRLQLGGTEMHRTYHRVAQSTARRAMKRLSIQRNLSTQFGLCLDQDWPKEMWKSKPRTIN